MLNNDSKSYGKRYMFDGNEETCWNSAEVRLYLSVCRLYLIKKILLLLVFPNEILITIAYLIDIVHLNVSGYPAVDRDTV